MAVAQHIWRLHSKLLHPDISSAPSMAAILKLDPTPALRENFNLREFALRTLAEDINVTEPPADAHLPSLQAVDESFSDEIQVRRLRESAAGDGNDQVDETHQEAGGTELADVNYGQAEEGKAAAGALDLLLLASTAGQPEETDEESSFTCGFCTSFTTDSVMILTAHIMECMEQHKGGEEKTRAILDLIADDSQAQPESCRQVPGHAALPLSQRSPKRSHRKRAARECEDFITEPLRKKKRFSQDRPRYKGILLRTSGRWAAQICNTKKKIRLWLGTFDTPEEAAIAYDRAAIEMFGAAAETNILSAQDVDVAGNGVVDVPVVCREDWTRLKAPSAGRSRRGKGRPRKQRLDEFFEVPVLCETDEYRSKKGMEPVTKEEVLDLTGGVADASQVEVAGVIDHCKYDTVVASGRFERGRRPKVKIEGACLSSGRDIVLKEEDSPRPLARKEPQGRVVIGRTVVEVLD